MLSYRTVFVIGAGASYEAGLPVGSTLKETISKKLDLYSDFRNQNIRGDHDIYAKLRHHAPSDLHSYIEASMMIHKGIVLSASIDDFIHIHYQDPKVTFCGKLAIAKSILEAESNSKLYVKPDNIYNTINFASLSNTWYPDFYQLLTQGVQKSSIESIFDNVTLIIFNYDRCIEHFLKYALAENYRMTTDEAGEIVQRVKIYRPYGSVGDYFGNNKVSFGSPSLPDMDRIITSLKTYSEELSDTEELEEMRRAVEASLRLIFLGNAYHQNNMKLLFDERFPNGKDVVSPKRVFATRRGISNVDLGIVKKSFDKVLYRPEPYPSDRDDYFFADTCYDLFQDYRMSMRV